MVQNNIIQKAVIDLDFNADVNAFELQREVSAWANADLSEALEQFFDRPQYRDGVWKIDKLELSIEANANENWREVAVRMIAQELERQLNEQKAAFKEAGHTNLNIQENVINAFIFFLENGSLPWWSPVTHKDAFFEALGLSVNDDLPARSQQVLFQLLQKESVRQRFSWQLPSPLFFLLLEKLQVIRNAYRNAIAEVENFLAILPGAYKNAAESLWKMILLESVHLSATINDETVLYKKFAAALVNKKNKGIADEILMIAHDSGVTQWLKEEIQRSGLSLPDESKEHGRESDHERIPDDNNDNSLTKEEKQRNFKKDQTPDSSVVDGLYINNAGLVIMAAFLPMFFKNLSLLEGESLKDRNKAAVLINYLASGEDVVAEFELGLARLLAGFSVDEPVDTLQVLTPEEKEEADDLLSSAIEYWNVLRDTTIDGLRDSFLRREGKLAFNGSEWILQVEQRGYDMLLQNLPWNISMVRLPWMAAMLKTEWVY